MSTKLAVFGTFLSTVNYNNMYAAYQPTNIYVYILHKKKVDINLFTIDGKY